MIRLTLPLPPSVNKRFTVKNGRIIKTQVTKDYERDAAKAIMVASSDRSIPVEERVKLHKHPEGPLHLEVHFYFPDNRRRDGDNHLKVVQDVISRALDFDDSKITDGTWRKRIDRSNPRCEVVLRSLGEE